jgi:co-chaperonin GroES (HSP10)
MSETPKAVGHYVLVETDPVEEMSDGGIYLGTNQAKKEARATEQGVVVHIGPCAYVGWEGCKHPDITPHKQWGIDIGDRVEFRKYEGKDSVAEGHEHFRYIPDTHIVGKIEV